MKRGCQTLAMHVTVSCPAQDGMENCQEPNIGSVADHECGMMFWFWESIIVQTCANGTDSKGKEFISLECDAHMSHMAISCDIRYLFQWRHGADEVQIAPTEIWAPIKGDVIIGEEDTERIGRLERGQVTSHSSRVKRWGLLRNTTIQTVKHEWDEQKLTFMSNLKWQRSLVSAVNQCPKVRRFASPARLSVRMKNKLKIEVQQFGYWVLFGFTGKHREESVTVNYDFTRGYLVQINGVGYNHGTHVSWSISFWLRRATMWFCTRPSLQPRTGIPSFSARRFPSFLRGL